MVLIESPLIFEFVLFLPRNKICKIRFFNKIKSQKLGNYNPKKIINFLAQSNSLFITQMNREAFSSWALQILTISENIILLFKIIRFPFSQSKDFYILKKSYVKFNILI